MNPELLVIGFLLGGIAHHFYLEAKRNFTRFIRSHTRKRKTSRKRLVTNK